MLNKNWTDKEESFNDESSCDKIFMGFDINNLNLNTAKQANSIL